MLQMSQEGVLSVLDEESWMSVKEIAKKLKISEGSINKSLNKLRKTKEIDFSHTSHSTRLNQIIKVYRKLK